MSSGHSFVLELPAEMVERLREIAARNGQTIENVIQEGLAVLFGSTHDENDPNFSILDSYTDEQLWAVVTRRQTWPDVDRLSELMARRKRSTLTPAEQIELEALLNQVDRYTLWRARALWLLRQRNYKVDVI